jgi:hypothetical protein
MADSSFRVPTNSCIRIEVDSLSLAGSALMRLRSSSMSEGTTVGSSVTCDEEEDSGSGFRRGVSQGLAAVAALRDVAMASGDTIKVIKTLVEERRGEVEGEKGEICSCGSLPCTLRRFPGYRTARRLREHSIWLNHYPPPRVLAWTEPRRSCAGDRAGRDSRQSCESSPQQPAEETSGWQSDTGPGLRGETAGRTGL